MDQNLAVSGKGSFQLGDCPPIELLWSKLVITSQITIKQKDLRGKNKNVVKTKTLLNRVKGVLRPKQFTAIIGPSGSGKTTLLNFLAGRLMSPNLQMTGDLFLNGQRINSLRNYSNRIGYVTQDDILLGTMTPLESFWFTANLKLNLSYEEKARRIHTLIKDLGLEKCLNTPVGSVMTRGISGGERKRVSIGVELLVDPSLLFLDEPTTGLDSSTSLQVIDLLTALAQSGRTVVSSIHQPSSEIFSKFDKLLLIVKGNIIYQGEAGESLQYFATQGFPCPKYNNPSDFFMKLMNEEGLLVEKLQDKEKHTYTSEQIKAEFEVRFQQFVNHYKGSYYYRQIEAKELNVIARDTKGYVASTWTQFSLILRRTFENQVRNPVDAKLKLMQYFIYALLIIIVFYNLGEGRTRIQNTTGLMFFISLTICFAAINSTISTFGTQRALYLKERYNRYYSVGAYFWGKSLAELPFQILYPTVMIGIIYFVIGLSTIPIDKFPIMIFIYFLTYWHAAAYGLLLSVFIPKVEIAMSIVPTVSVTFLSSAGFFTTQNNIPYALYPFMYLSFFRYGFQAGVMNEFRGVTLDCQGGGCDPLKMYAIDYQTFWIPVIIQFGLGVLVRCVAWFGLWMISKPKKLKLKPTDGASV